VSLERDVAQITGRLLAILEACSSVALSHEQTCPCMVCRAAHGDMHALWTVAEELER
jgi:hypothetical protein